MSRQRERDRHAKRDAQCEERHTPAPHAALRKHTLGRRLILVLAILVGGTLGMWALMRQRKAPPPLPPISATDMADSALAADAKQDFGEVLRWARLMAATEPSNPSLVLLIGIALHNYSFVGSRYGRERSATRTSLERIEMESRALVLIDSAAAGMRSDEEWAEAMSSGGQINENLGLPLDALQYYTTLRARAPDYTPVIPRVIFVVKSLRDPLTIPSGPMSLTSL
jgi:hypothetical protein